MKRKSSRLVPRPENGLVDPDAPFWRGDTAERVLKQRLEEARAKSLNRRKGPKSARRSARASSPGEKDLRRELRRLERALPRRKTLAARQRLQMRIDQLRKELGL